jgi:hypothetical protein
MEKRMIWILTAVVIGLLNWYAPADPTSLERVLASAIILTCFWGIRHWQTHPSRRESGFLPMVMFVYIMFFPLSIFTLLFYNYKEPFSPSSVGDDNLEKALLLTLIGIICLLFGYYYPGREEVRSRLPKIRLRWNNPTIVARVSVISGALSLLTFVITYESRLDSSVQAWVNFPNEFVLLAAIALFVLQLQGRLSAVSVIALWGFLIPGRFVLGMAQGVFFLGLVLMVGLVVAYATVRHRFPWTILLVGAAGFCVLQPVKGSMREEVFAGGWANPEMATIDKVQSLSDLPARGLAALDGLGFTTMVSLSSSRLADEVLFAHIIAYTPEEVPYWDGESYSPFATFLIPRILYPEKLQYQPGNVLGHRYDILPPYDYLTSINLPQLVEFYINFGPWAVGIGGFLIGVVYRTVNDLFMDDIRYFGSLVAGIFILARFADVENSGAFVFGPNLIMGILVVAVFHMAIRFSEKIVCALAVYRGVTILEPPVEQLLSNS